MRKAFGKHVARQIPARFDFSKHALVWIDLRATKKPRLRIVRVPAKRRLYLQHSSALNLAVERKARALIFTLSSGAVCSGGIRKPRHERLACLRAVTASISRAQATLLLFATKRARLQRVILQRRAMPGRPGRPGRPRRP